MRSFFFIGTIILAALMSFSSCSQEEPVRPNILFAIADDWGWPHAGSYGDPVVQTPAFDRLASEGVLFNHAYISSPSCTPSRNAILTGQYHWRLGPGANLWSTLDSTIPVYPLLLEDAGYKTGRFRKSWGPGDISNWKRHPAGADYTAAGFEGFMKERKKTKEPFCFFLGTSDPHRPYIAGTGAASGINPDDIELFSCFPDHELVRNDVADYYYEVQRFDSLVADAIRVLEQYGELENTIIVMTGDHGMPFPRCKSNNYDSGARIPLAIRWGSGIAYPGRKLDDFVSTTDLAPTFLELAGVEVPDVMTGKSLKALLESSSEGLIEDVIRSYVLHGKERHVPGQEDGPGGYPVRAIRTHSFLYIRNFDAESWPSGTPNYLDAYIPGCWLGDCDNGPTKSYMVEHRDDDEEHRFLYELAFGLRPSEELYDCINDPGQLNNLADNPDYYLVKGKLEALLMRELHHTGDPRAYDGTWKEIDEVPYLGHGPRHPDWKQQ